jgi:hypothetical protein
LTVSAVGSWETDGRSSDFKVTSTLALDLIDR